MKNKFLLSILLIGLISFFSISCFAYEDSRFSIDIPENYEKTSKNSVKNSYVTFTKDTRENITISFVPTESPSSSTERKNALKEISNSVKTSIEKELGTTISIKSSDITTFSKNNYDCLAFKYYIDKFDMYQMQYTFFTDNYACSIAITALSEDFLDETQPIIDSFTVTDTITDSSSSDFTISLIFVSVTAVLIIGFFVVYFIVYSSRKKKNLNNNNETSTSINSVENISEEISTTNDFQSNENESNHEINNDSNNSDNEVEINEDKSNDIIEKEED